MVVGMLVVVLLLLVVVVVGTWQLLEPVRAAKKRRGEAEVEAFERAEWAEAQEGEKAERPGLSIVIPAYNEKGRLPGMLGAVSAYAKERPSLKYEIVVVDDGSVDATSETARTVGLELFGPGKVRVARLRKNRGKGGAVREGALRARGDWVLLADADGATRIDDLDRLRAAVDREPGPALAVGSRAHLVRSDVVARRSPLRNLLMRAFHLVVTLVGGVSGIRDTQCGFKLFNRAALPVLFAIHLERWAFDVELLYLAQRLRYVVKEVPVDWTEIPGSKLDVLTDSLRMARDIACLRFAYLSGLWKLPPPSSSSSSSSSSP